MGIGVGVLQGFLSGMKDLQARSLEIQKLQEQRAQHEEDLKLKRDALEASTSVQNELSKLRQRSQTTADKEFQLKIAAQLSSLDQQILGVSTQISRAESLGVPGPDIERLRGLYRSLSESRAAVQDLDRRTSFVGLGGPPEPKVKSTPEPKAATAPKRSGDLVMPSPFALPPPTFGPRVSALPSVPQAAKPKPAPEPEPKPSVSDQRDEFVRRLVEGDPSLTLHPMGGGNYEIVGENAKVKAEAIQQQIGASGATGINILGTDIDPAKAIKDAQTLRGAVTQILQENGVPFQMTFSDNGKPIGMTKLDGSAIKTEDVSPEIVSASVDGLQKTLGPVPSTQYANVLAEETLPVFKGWVENNTTGSGGDRVIDITNDFDTQVSLSKLATFAYMVDNNSTTRKVGYSIRMPSPDEAIAQAVNKASAMRTTGLFSKTLSDVGGELAAALQYIKDSETSGDVSDAAKEMLRGFIRSRGLVLKSFPVPLLETLQDVVGRDFIKDTKTTLFPLKRTKSARLPFIGKM